MQITTKGCYGLRALVDLAMNQSDNPVQLGSIANRIGVSRKYLHAMLVVLKSTGIIRSTRGSCGGYHLGRSPEKISVAEVLQALEGGLVLRDCVKDTSVCERSGKCVTRRLWSDLGAAIESHLSSISLQDLVDWDGKSAKGKSLIDF